MPLPVWTTLTNLASADQDNLFIQCLNSNNVWTKYNKLLHTIDMLPTLPTFYLGGSTHTATCRWRNCHIELLVLSGWHYTALIQFCWITDFHFFLINGIIHLQFTNTMCFDKNYTAPQNCIVYVMLFDIFYFKTVVYNSNLLMWTCLIDTTLHHDITMSKFGVIGY